jgi:hypothetical protein
LFVPRALTASILGVSSLAERELDMELELQLEITAVWRSLSASILGVSSLAV